MNEVIQNNIKLEFFYDVHFSQDIFHFENVDLINTISKVDIKEINTVSVFVDQGVVESHQGLIDKILHYFEVHGTKLKLLGNPFLVPGGEVCKTDINVLERIYHKLYDDRVDRHTFVLAIGGGAMLDAVGYVAATTHRGIRLLRVPTTVLAQNDAGIGVKAGVNRFGIKNFIGSFVIPSAVINDTFFLNSLSDRDKRSGMAEAIKAALIRDSVFFEWLESNVEDLTSFKEDAVKHMIKRCAELHLLQITTGGDPFETGSSRPLDFGHWAAHKLETMSGYELKHGEAVAIGMAIDTRYSLDTHRITRADYERIISLMAKLGFKLVHPAMKQRHENGALVLLDGIDEFREHLGGESTITVLNSIGSSTEINDVCSDMMEQSIILLLREIG
ncbi:3-dehydroquinate synthase [Nitrosomonas sp.]|uniref:3-dehydroquinate synthase n=1 Tax=Nitrosomonas sp. TaxID=42353 RepID=UPI0033056CA7